MIIMSTPCDSSQAVCSQVKGRVLYNVPSSSPPRFGLSLHPRVVSLDSDTSLQDNYPIGLVLDDVRVKAIERDQGVIVEVSTDINGFVHVSHCVYTMRPQH